LETRIERQRTVTEELETEGHGSKVIYRSRLLLQQMITDLDQLLLQLSDSKSGAGAPIKAEQDILTGAQTFPP
jgi:hypothetical protein